MIPRKSIFLAFALFFSILTYSQIDGHSHIALNKTTQLGDTQTIALGHLPSEVEVCATAHCVSVLRYDLKTKELRIE